MRLDKKLAYISFYLVLWACNSPKIRVPVGAFYENTIDTVSIDKVLVNPGEYHQRVLSIEGFTSFGFEMSAIFKDRSSRRNFNFEHAIWVIPSPSFTKAQSDSIERFFNNKRVRVIGQYNSTLHGHLGYSNGTLEIFSIEQF